ncbi:unnamed protein product, partial [Closterium sp. NIES-53]
MSVVSQSHGREEREAWHIANAAADAAVGSAAAAAAAADVPARAADAATGGAADATSTGAAASVAASTGAAASVAASTGAAASVAASTGTAGTARPGRSGIAQIRPHLPRRASSKVTLLHPHGTHTHTPLHLTLRHCVQGSWSSDDAGCS